MNWFTLLSLAVIASAGSIVAADDNVSIKVLESREDDVRRGERFPFRTFLVTRSLNHERLIPYLKAALPEIVQIGNYGAMFHGHADHPKSTGTPMMLPVVGERAALQFQRKLNAEVHALGLTVVGHFRLVKVMGDWDEQTGFVDYYNKRWPEDLLGPKPHPELKELLQRDAGGKPIQVARYENAQLTLCLSSPHARQMLKQMLKCAIDHGVDGVMTTFNYRFNCACPYCQRAFKEWLAKHYSAAELEAKLGIPDLAAYVFPSIPTAIPGYPDPAEAKELDWLAIRWGAEHFKQMYDDIFLNYGRSLKPNLLVGQWNHLSHVSLKEERMFLPLALWGRGEDYFWYSGGAAFVGKNLNLAEGKAGDAWLSCLYVREMSGHKPFVMGKYDRVRMAASMAEGYATGGLGMGRYMRFEDPAGFEVLARYTNFMHRNRKLFEEAAVWADAALVLPRQTILAGRPEALDMFRELGQALVERQVLLDVLVDEKLSAERLARYPAVILPQTVVLSDSQLALLRSYAANGGQVLLRGETGTRTETDQPRRHSGIGAAIAFKQEATAAAAEEIVSRLCEGGGSVIHAPWTVRASAYTQPARMIVHLVNYDRDETPVKGVNGPELERPRAVKEIAMDLRMPPDRRATSVTLHTPEAEQSTTLAFQANGNRISFTVPQVNVYAVLSVETQSR